MINDLYLREQLQAKENMLSQTTRFLVQIQKDLEEKNKLLLQANSDIFESINFAIRIQNSLLPDAEILKIFFKDATYKVTQKIGIGGDNIFVKNTNDGIVFGLLDSTGHGIPASLLSISSTLLLRELMTSMEITNPQNLLNLLNNQLHKTYNSGLSSIAHNEGILFSFSSTKKTLTYSSARGKAFILKSFGQILELSFTKNSIGDNANIEFELYDLAIQPKDKLFIYSDGLTDQFGGEKNKKFSRQKLKKLLSEISNENVKIISETVQMESARWKGDNEQTDDVSFMLIEF